jgi:hypothetical protein
MRSLNMLKYLFVSVLSLFLLTNALAVAKPPSKWEHSPKQGLQGLLNSHGKNWHGFEESHEKGLNGIENGNKGNAKEWKYKLKPGKGH